MKSDRFILLCLAVLLQTLVLSVSARPQSQTSDDSGSSQSSGSSSTQSSLLQSMEFNSPELYKSAGAFGSELAPAITNVLLNNTKIAVSLALGNAYDAITDPSVSNFTSSQLPRESYIDVSSIDSLVNNQFEQSMNAFSRRKLRRRQFGFVGRLFKFAKSADEVAEGAAKAGMKSGVDDAAEGAAKAGMKSGVDDAAEGAGALARKSSSLTDDSLQVANVARDGMEQSAAAAKPGSLSRVVNSPGIQLGLIGIMGAGLIAQGVGMGMQHGDTQRSLEMQKEMMEVNKPTQNYSSNALAALNSIKTASIDAAVSSILTLSSTNDLKNYLTFTLNGVADYNTTNEFCSDLRDNGEALTEKLTDATISQGFFSTLFNTLSTGLYNVPVSVLAKDVPTSVTQVVSLPHMDVVLPRLQSQFQDVANRAGTSSQQRIAGLAMSSYQKAFCSSQS